MRSQAKAPSAGSTTSRDGGTRKALISLALLAFCALVLAPLAQAAPTRTELPALSKPYSTATGDIASGSKIVTNLSVSSGSFEAGQYIASTPFGVLGGTKIAAVLSPSELELSAASVATVTGATLNANRIENTPCGTATDAEGNYYVSSNSSIGLRVTIYSPDGTQLNEFGPTSLPCSIAVDSAGRLYMRSSSGGSVTRYKPSSPPPITGSTTYAVDTTLNGTGQLVGSSANTVAVDPQSGRVLIGEAATNEKQTFTRPLSTICSPATEFTLSFEGQTASGPATPLPCESASNAQIQAALNSLSTIGGVGGSVTVTGTALKTVEFKGSLGLKDIPAKAIVVKKKEAGEPLLSESDTSVEGHIGRISIFQPDGTLISNTTGSGVSGGSYYGVDAYGANGRVYATDIAHNKALIFEAGSPTPLLEVDGSGSPACTKGAFTSMSTATIAVDQANGNFLVSDVAGHSVVDEFNAAGKCLATIEHSPALETALPADIAIDSSATANKGNLYLSSGSTSGKGALYAYGPAAPTKTLATTSTPGASGSVKCYSDTNSCSSSYSEGSSVELRAVPASGFKFAKWKEATGSAASCKNATNPICTVELNANSSAEAEFELAGFKLSVTKPGTGTGKVTSTPSGIDCGSDCEETYAEGTLVSLSQSADPGSTFKGWGGDCSGTGACQVTMSAAKNVSATFTAAPVVTTTSGATNITPKKAEVAGSVNPKGTQITASSCKVEYGTAAPAYGSTAPCVPADPGAGSSPVAVTAQLSGLTPGTTYHFRFVASNAGGEGQGADQTFATPALLAPEVETKAASALLKESATLNASVNPKLEEVTDCHFEYGTTIAYLGGTKPCSPSPGSGNSPVNVSGAISSLTPGQTYHFRVVATNAGGTSSGLDKEFTTPTVISPTVTTTAGATSITQTSVKVAGSVNPNGVAITACEVEYGTSLPSGTTTACEQSPGSIGSGSSAVPVSAQISTLNPDTTYHFRFIAKNAEPAEGKGSDQEFKTLTNVPTISGLSPNKGPAVGGTQVTITGTNFTGATQVKFGSTNATTFTVESGTQIKATSPSGTGAADVSVTTPGGTSANTSADDFAYVPAPAITTCAPPSGPIAGGTQVTITGTNLTGATEVKFGSTNATTFTVESATQVKATSPAGSAGATTITVITPGGTSNTCAFTYAVAPTVSGISPNQGPTAAGAQVTITGTNLTGATAVKFGATNATTFTVESATQVKATAPSGSAGTVDVTITTPGGTSATGAPDKYTYVALPTISGVSPNQGPTAGGTSVTITGTNLTAATQVKFGSTNATTFTVESANQIKATAPAGSAGTVDVTATTLGGTSATGANDKYTYVAAPTVTTNSGASSASQTTATVGGTVNPNSGNVTACKVEYGTTAGYGSEKACASLPGAGSSAVAVSAALSGLSANTTYHFRVVATNVGGSSNGADQTFTTQANTCETDSSLCPPPALQGPLPAPSPAPSPAPKPLKCKKGFKKKTVKGKAKCVKVKKKHRKAHKGRRAH